MGQEGFIRRRKGQRKCATVRETSICRQSSRKGPRGLASGEKPGVGEDDVGDAAGQGGWDPISKAGRSKLRVRI